MQKLFGNKEHEHYFEYEDMLLGVVRCLLYLLGVVTCLVTVRHLK
jgi:hypothetical protein